MEPLDDKELNQLLRQWDAPAAPSSLRNKVAPTPMSWHRWLLTGTIRVPVPVGVAAALILSVWMWAGRTTPTPIPQPASSITLADFQPVRQLEPVVISNSDGRQNNENQQYK